MQWTGSVKIKKTESGPFKVKTDVRLSTQQQQLYDRAVNISRRYLESEWDLVETIIEIHQTRLFQYLGCSSLFAFVVKELNLSEAQAYMMITVARKCSVQSELRLALRDRRLTVSKASRIVSAINNQNASALIEFAEHNVTRAIDREVARLNPARAREESTRWLDQDHIRISLTVSQNTFDQLQRAREIMQQGALPTMEWTLAILLDHFLERKDPVIRAQRAVQGRAEKSGKVKRTDKVEKIGKPSVETSVDKPSVDRRRPLTAVQRHAVVTRDGGQCTHQDASGIRCTNRRWLHSHHINAVANGGSNDPHNLTTLCSMHHDLVHQLGLPLEGQINWLRSGQTPYLRRIDSVQTESLGWLRALPK